MCLAKRQKGMQISISLIVINGNLARMFIIYKYKGLTTFLALYLYFKVHICPLFEKSADMSFNLFNWYHISYFHRSKANDINCNVVTCKLTSHSSHCTDSLINQNQGSLEPIYLQIFHPKLEFSTNLLLHPSEHVKFRGSSSSSFVKQLNNDTQGGSNTNSHGTRT